MKKCFIIWGIIALPLIMLAQSRLTYNYDAAGNRIKKTLALSPITAKKQNKNPNQSKGDFSFDYSVKIYPNPTKGDLRITTSGLRNSQCWSLDIFSAKGNKIYSYDVTSDVYDIDISNQPSGIYLLNISINGQSKSWKIIKL